MQKKPFVKVLSLALAAITLFTLCACGTAASSPAAGPVSDAAPTEASAASNGVLDEIKASGELHITLSPDFAPMEFIDSSKDGQEQYVGLDVFLAKYIADYIGVKLVIEPMSFDACQTAVYTASVPMSVSGYVWTEERAESYEISDYYYDGDNKIEPVILIRTADAEKYTSSEDFNGVDIGAQNASLQMQLVTSQLPDANPVAVGDVGTGVLELQNGSIEALAVAKGNAEIIMDANPDLVLCPWEFTITEETEAFVILLTKGETALLNVVNEALAKAYSEGMYGAWHDEAVALAKVVNGTEE